MNGLAFFDTNVLVYCDDSSWPEKQNRAIELFTRYQRNGLAVISLQVLQEYYIAATGKLKMEGEAVEFKVGILAQGQVIRMHGADIVSAIELHRLRRISFWDALIVQAARISGATILYTEDLQHGAKFGSVRVVNPFLESTALESGS